MSQAIQSKTPAEILGTLNDVEAKNAPRMLYLQGDATLLTRGPRVSVVGSRKATHEGLSRTSALVRALVDHEMIVVSGLAAGIDARAHGAAIEAGGRTIAVLGTSLDQAYPAENKSLQDRIGREHLLVSQFPLGAHTTPKNFPIRNRTMALLTDATVIVEAGEGSGTLHQGWEALRLGRLLFLMESVTQDPGLEWPKEMLQYGAQILSRSNLDESLADIPAVTSRVGVELDALY
jgi:DNA processing protein